MDRQMYGQKDVWIDRCINKQMYGYVWIDRCIGRQIDVMIVRQKDGNIDIKIDRWMEDQINRWKDGFGQRDNKILRGQFDLKIIVDLNANAVELLKAKFLFTIILFILSKQ